MKTFLFVICLLTVLVIDSRNAPEFSATEFNKILLNTPALLKSYLDTDWLSIVDGEMKKSSDVSTLTLRANALRFRFLPWHIITSDVMDIISSLKDEALFNAFEKVINEVNSPGWSEVDVPWYDTDTAPLYRMLSSLQSIEVRQSTAETVHGMVKFDLRQRIEVANLDSVMIHNGTAVCALRAALGMIRGSCWPLRRLRAVAYAISANNSPFVSERILQILLEVRNGLTIPSKSYLSRINPTAAL